MSYSVSRILPANKRAMAQVDALLTQEGLQRDQNLDYTCGIFDEDYRVIATGSCFGSTLRCFAVDKGHQGEGLLNDVMTHLIEAQAARGNFHLFLYTKPGTARFFGDLGFYEIARVPDRLVFMENRRDGFSGYLAALKKSKREDGVSSAILMNANPFTLGHQYLVETAAAQCDTLHLFVVSEDASLIPASVRKRLVQEGVRHLPNVILHDCGPYMISSATFPSYFLKDSEAVIESQARLDVRVFIRIAAALNITARYVGEEPASQVTRVYNQVMARELPASGIACQIIPRKALNGQPISASTVRRAIQTGDDALLRSLVPETTWAYFQSQEAQPVIQRIRSESNVIHY